MNFFVDLFLQLYRNSPPLLLSYARAVFHFYFNFLHVYSVASLKQIRKPSTNCVASGLSLSSGSALSQEMLFTEFSPSVIDCSMLYFSAVSQQWTSILSLQPALSLWTSLFFPLAHLPTCIPELSEGVYWNPRIFRCRSFSLQRHSAFRWFSSTHRLQILRLANPCRWLLWVLYRTSGLPSWEVSHRSLLPAVTFHNLPVHLSLVTRS